MEILEYKKNLFTCNGTPEQLNDLKSILETLKSNFGELKNSSTFGFWFNKFYDFCDDFDAVYEKLENGKNYRLTGLANDKISDFERPLVDFCDECGGVYSLSCADYKGIKEATQFKRSEALPTVFVKDPSGAFVCRSRCAVFDMIETSRGNYIPIKERERVDGLAVVRGDNLHKNGGFFYKKKGSKILPVENYFCKDDGQNDGRRMVYLKKNFIMPAYCTRKRGNETEMYFFEYIGEYDLLRPKKYFFRDMSKEQRQKIEKNLKEKGVDLFDTFEDRIFKINEDGFLFHYRTQRWQCLNASGNIYTVNGRDAYDLGQDGFYVCPRCGTYIKRSDAGAAFFHRDDEHLDEIDLTAFCDYGCLCKNCMRECRRDPYTIRSYQTKFDNIIPGVKCFQKLGAVARAGNDNLYYGVELEANAKGDRDETVRKVLKRLEGYVFAKRDGSLDEDQGVEFVSAPATFEKTRAIWSKLFNTKYARRDSEDLSCGDLTAWSDPRCGLHIHISRNALRCTDICHVVYFINKWVSFCEKIAGRAYYENKYTRVKHIFDNSDPARAVQDCLREFDGHYDAVNVENSSTIEIRIFKSNVTMSALFRCLEFTDALVCFSKSLGTIDFGKMTPAAFMSYCAGRNKYKFLNDFFKKHDAFFKGQKKRTLKIK